MKNIFKNSILVFLFLFCGVTAAQAQFNNNSLRLNQGWEFLKGDLGGIWEAFRPAKQGRPETVPLWTEVRLPHCVNERDAVNPDVNYYQGPAWYRSLLEIANPFENGRTILHFEGAGQKTEVYVFTTKVAAHVGGYDEWSVDITDAVSDFLSSDEGKAARFKGKVPVAIRTDNSRDLEMIPSDMSDFNVYGGIYRYLNLVYLPETYIGQVHIKPSILKKSNGKVHLSIDLVNEAGNRPDLQITVKDPNKQTVYETQLSTTSNVLEHDFELKKIQLWSTDNPFLYSLEIKTLGEAGGQVYSDHFGFREFRFEQRGPFYLNGERLLIRGTHRHEDHAGVAAAMTEDMIRQEMQLMKDMGVNFIRLGHYQQSRIVLNLCDSLGILVWEEIPWCRGGLGGKIYQDQAKRMLTNMINQHYNHPSVIVWGLGNENDWPGDFPEFDKQKIRSFMSELHELSHELDPERKTGIRRCDFCKDIVDVYSPSIWAGWYRGKFTEYKEVSHKEMLEVDHFFHMEWGGSSHAGRHDESPDKGLEDIKTGQGADERAGDASLVGGDARVSRDGNWSETYICNLFDWHLKEQGSMPWLTGAAQWAFKDFSTPVRPENPVPYVNQKGVMERDLTPKESYYVFQSYWTDKPMIHIYGHSWPVRWGDEGQSRLVKVYSSCKEVELFLNGISLGKKKRNVENYPAAGLYWNVFFKAGKNELKAVSTTKGQVVEDVIELEYQTQKWGEVAKLELAEQKIDDQFSWLLVKAFDKNQVLCLDAKNRIEFAVAGDVILIDDLGTPSGSRKVELSNGQAKIKIKRTGTAYSAFVKSDGLQTVQLENQKDNFRSKPN